MKYVLLVTLTILIQNNQSIDTDLKITSDDKNISKYVQYNTTVTLFREILNNNHTITYYDKNEKSLSNLPTFVIKNIKKNIIITCEVTLGEVLLSKKLIYLKIAINCNELNCSKNYVCNENYIQKFPGCFDQCKMKPCLNGECINDNYSFYCKCSKFWKGKFCNKDVNECLDLPCKHGECMNTNGSFICKCDINWSGRFCDIDINYCRSNPCHYGNCSNSLYSFKCICNDSWTGKFCNKDLNECYHYEKFCSHGVCMNTIGSYTCKCSPGYTGRKCNKLEQTHQHCSLNCQEGICVFINHNKNKRMICSCNNGLRGDNCAIDINECSLNPCRNSGKCINTVGSFYCVCRKNWSGSICEKDDLDCLNNNNECNNKMTCVNINNRDGRFNSNTRKNISKFRCVCKNGFKKAKDGKCQDINECNMTLYCKNGKCQNYLGSYSCTCISGFIGQTCMEEYNPCKKNPCKNGGHCKFQNIDIGFYCECAKKFYGIYCSSRIEIENICKEITKDNVINPCQNNGTCLHLSFGTYKCECKNHIGKHCITEIDGCVNKSCTNGGYCEKRNYDYVCNCVKGYKGNSCEKDVNECFLSPCNFGKCLNNHGSFTCICNNGYGGILCDSKLDSCKDNKCHGNATCINVANTYRCLCSEYYIGTLCNIDKDECIDDPCENDGKCINIIQGHICICRQKFSGDLCNIAESEINLTVIVVVLPICSLLLLIGILINRHMKMKFTQHELKSTEKSKSRFSKSNLRKRSNQSNISEHVSTHSNYMSTGPLTISFTPKNGESVDSTLSTVKDNSMKPVKDNSTNGKWAVPLLNQRRNTLFN